MLAGRSELEADQHRLLFMHLSRSTLQLHCLGWRPLTNYLEYVIWSPHELNTVADHAINATMDCGRDWEQTSPHMRDIVAANMNLRLCIDGG
eukprot:5482720-Karenia_brevis.AAC.1